MTVNFDQIREHLRNTDIGREVDFFYPDYLPDRDDVSEGKMAWIEGAVLYCDISGYTNLTHSNREELISRILIGFHSSMVRITNQCQGRVVGFAGDRVMSVFVTDDPNKTINNVMTCALAMQSVIRYILPEEYELRNFNVNFSCTIGIEFGNMLMGRFGAGKTTDITFVGDAANYAAKYQTEAKTGYTLISKYVYDNLPNWMTKSKWYSRYVTLSEIGSVYCYESDAILKYE